MRRDRTSTIMNRVTAVTVFGSCNMDLVAYVATRPQPGETVHGHAFRTVVGGKGCNQAIAAARAGAPTSLIAATGSDQFGGQIRATLESSGVDTTCLREVTGNTGTAHITVDDSGGNSIIVIPAANGTMDRLFDGAAELIAASQLLLLQLETPLEGVVAAARLARQHGVKVVLTPAPAMELPHEVLCNVDVVVPNEHEATAITGLADHHAALTRLLKFVPEVVMTRGEHGVCYGSQSGDRIEVPAYPVRAVDTTGAGDTFVGAFSAAITAGTAIRPALIEASAAAALSVQRTGASTSMPSRQEIVEFLS